MSDWLLNLPVRWMGALIVGAVHVCTAGLYVLITRLARALRAAVLLAAGYRRA